MHSNKIFVSSWTAMDWRHMVKSTIVMEVVQINYYGGYSIHYVVAPEEKIDLFKACDMIDLLVFNQN